MVDRSAIRILTVDDDPLMLKLNMHALASLGYTSVTTCESAQHALDAIDFAETAPDLILMDLSMPVMDGIEFMRHLVKRSYSGSLILVSGEDDRMLQAAEKLALAHQITTLGCLRKPLKLELLAALLEKWAPAIVSDTEHWSPLELSRTAKLKKFYSADTIRAAITNGEMINYYQPMVSLTTGQVVGVEALVRWNHPADGLVFPDRFIGVAEEHGLIKDLTRKVVSNALKHTKVWRQKTGLEWRVAINVSMDDLSELSFVDFIAGELVAAGVPATDVTLEVMESRLLQDLRIPLEVLTRLRLKRFRISIDDFGTGHSSLAQLRNMPFDELKIDRGFVHSTMADPTIRAIFDTSVLLGKQLGMLIVAEGVEDRADWDYVCRSGCDVAQGYFIARPMPEDELQDCIEDWEERALLFTQKLRKAP